MAENKGHAVVPFASMSFPELNRPLVERGVITLLPEPEPRTLWCPIISVDDHLMEPFDIFTSRLPDALAERAPVIVEDERGLPFWRIDDAFFPITIANGASGRPLSEWYNAPQTLDDFRPGVSDVKARVRDMDINGVWASLCFPSFTWGFAGRRFSTMRDSEVGLACLRAYNDWVIEQWCGYDRARFIPCQVPWLRDPRVAATEILANAERGFRSVTFPETPERLGFPSIYSDEWDPFFRACEETSTVVNLHVGASGLVARPSAASPHEVEIALFPINGVMAMIDWLYARIPIRFPALNIALSEAGVSWLPMMMERLERAYRHVEASSVWSTADPHPNDLVRRNFWFTSIEDPSAFQLLDQIGEDKVMLETDYPHKDSTWPDTQELIRSELEHLPSRVVRKVAFETAARLYQHELPPTSWIDSSAIANV